MGRQNEIAGRRNIINCSYHIIFNSRGVVYIMIMPVFQMKKSRVLVEEEEEDDEEEVGVDDD